MEITINIDTRTKAGINLLNFLKSLSFVTIKERENEEDIKLYKAMLKTKNDKLVSRKTIMNILEK